MTREAQRAEALRLFRIVHGTGDEGSEFEFEAMNMSVQAGWLRLASSLHRDREKLFDIADVQAGVVYGLYCLEKLPNQESHPEYSAAVACHMQDHRMNWKVKLIVNSVLQKPHIPK